MRARDSVGGCHELEVVGTDPVGSRLRLYAYMHKASYAS